MRQYAAGRAVATGWFDWLTKHGSIDGGVAVLATWIALLAGRAAEAGTLGQGCCRPGEEHCEVARW